MAVGYSINNDNQGLGNPYALWKSYGSGLTDGQQKPIGMTFNRK
jgi:hypothetical protein